MMDKKMTLEQVRDWHRSMADAAKFRSAAITSVRMDEHNAMADAIDAELKARREAVAWCCPDDPHNSTAFSWPGTARVLSRHTMPLYGAPPAPEITNEALVKLARRCLWLAYVWNDHNFDAAHACARKTAEDVGIESFEEANTWLQALKEIP